MIRKQLGLDKSIPEQLGIYLRDIATGNLGRSMTTGQPVTSDLVNRLPASLELTLSALLIALCIAFAALTALIAPDGKVIYRHTGAIEPLEVKRAIVEFLGRTYASRN